MCTEAGIGVGGRATTKGYRWCEVILYSNINVCIFIIHKLYATPTCQRLAYILLFNFDWERDVI